MQTAFDLQSHYRRLGQVGQGQFGRVYFGIHRQNGHLAALKDLSPQQFPTHKFLRELAYLATLQHPNIVSFVALEHHRHGRYLIASYCEAGTLRDLMESQGVLNPLQALALVEDILQGLDYAHRRHIIHCDLKPENILLSLKAGGWLAQISDFGISQLGRETGMPSTGKGYTGSPAYMAPERFYGQFSPASDLYAVGVLLYELIAGNRPFSGLPKDIMAAHLNQKPNLPERIPPILRPTLERSLQKLPQNRFASALEMLKAVQIAGQALRSRGSRQLWLAPPSLAGGTLFSPPILWQQDFPREVEQLAASDRYFFWRSGQQVGYFPLAAGFSESPSFGEVGLPGLLDYLQIRHRDCWLATRSEGNWFLYCWQPPQPFPSKPYFAARGSRHCLALSPGGEWGFLAVGKEGENSYQAIDFARPRMQQIPNLTAFPRFLIALDRRHALAVTDAKTQHSTFHLFNRRAQPLGAFSFPLQLRSLTLGKFEEPILLGIEAADPPLGLAISLAPLRFRRFPLAIDPAFIEAFAWGFCLGDRQGQGILVDRQGVQFAQFSLGAETTAIASAGRTHLLVATLRQGRSQMALVDLEPFLKLPD